METQQLDALLALRRETQTFEVKGCAPFSVEFLAKDILAMANHRDGGYIVIGIEDETFARQGVDQETINTYKVDVMRDKMAKFATPAIRFDVDVVTGQDGLRFVVIDVATFDRVPVVCRSNNNKDVYPGMIYYRGSQGRVRSEAISNADDMLDLVVTLAGRRAEDWLRERGFVRASPVSEPRPTTPTDQFNERLDEELDGL